jgi:Relaxase/Mobilisation nuclease domain
MIIKGQSRSRNRQLSAHLLRKDQNESVRLYEVRGTVAGDVEGALAEMEARGAAAASKRPLYHASISPEAHTPLTDAQIRIAIDTLEEALGFSAQPRIVVVHRKENREHVHVVWSRVDADRNRAIPDSWNYRCHEEVARTLETLFGHRPIPRSDSWKRGRKVRAPRDYELRQEERTGKPTVQITAEITALWRSAGDAQAFQARLEEAGYRLARGDRRVLVVIDRNGEVHSLARRIDGVNTRDLRLFFRDVDLQILPSVAEVRQEPVKESSATRLRRDFRAAACQVAQPQALAPQAARFVRAMRKPNPAVRSRFSSAASGTEGGVSGNSLNVRSRGHVAPRSTRYRVFWAIVIADFAAKIANAYRHTPSHELEAALAALHAEREAALSTLAQQQRGEAREHRKVPRLRKSRASRPHYIRRVRIKRWRFKE